MVEIFTSDIREKIQRELERYETPRSAILPVLHLIQDQYGWIQPVHVEGLEKEFGLPRVQVQEVATFYSMYRLEPAKPLRILFCDNLVCCMMGAKEVMDKIHARIEVLPHNENPFSLQGVPCLGVCDGAPAMLVNKDRHLRVTPDTVDAILDTYVKGTKSK
jgi:NADH-quinone oxidoreductase subunit E